MEDVISGDTPAGMPGVPECVIAKCSVAIATIATAMTAKVTPLSVVMSQFLANA
jgi:hypothetical protein